jgi:hypothetical protein
MKKRRKRRKERKQMREFLVNLINGFVETAKVEIGIAEDTGNLVKEIGKEMGEIWNELDE